jgi:predicted SAM-dependent methyltransferase/glycosyltransferase involved in cell wall biosynthesis
MSEKEDGLHKVKLNVGCGTVYMDGWINIDNNIEKLDMNVDLRNGLPFENNSADFIFNEHFLEHLTWDEGLQAVKEFMRVLKPGGVLRIAMPDLGRSVRIYQDENWKENNSEYFEKYELAFVETRAQNLNIDFRSWGHKHLYDFEELERLQKEAGCDNIWRRFFRESIHKELRGLETRNESTLIVEIEKGPVSVPLLTVVCITYNHENYIRDALESFIVQKTNFPFEVIVSDDASQDGTPEIIREYEEKYGNIIKPIYRKANLGAMNNFIQTLREARSKYVVYNEGDDYFSDPYKLQKQVDFLESHPECSICFHPVIVRFQDGSKLDEVFPSPEFRFNRTELFMDDLIKYNFMQTNSVMYRWRFISEDLQDVLPSSILPGDYYLHLLHAQKGGIGFIDEIMAVYRRHPEGIWWNSLTPEKLHIRYCAEMFNFYYEVYKNITGDQKSYYSNTLVPFFNTLISSAQTCGEAEKLKPLFKQHPQFVMEQYLRASDPINILNLQVSEMQKQISALTHSASYRISRKLMSNHLLKRMYLICKKAYKLIRRPFAQVELSPSLNSFKKG